MRTRRLGSDLQLQKVAGKALVLSKGARGSGVGQIQDLLGSLGFALPKSLSRAGADGVFGSETERAVKDFQKSHGLKNDGLIGPKTLEALEEEILRGAFLESPDPIREAALNSFDSSAPHSQKRSLYL